MEVQYHDFTVSASDRPERLSCFLVETGGRPGRADQESPGDLRRRLQQQDHGDPVL